jgi:hypothetical protein
MKSNKGNKTIKNVGWMKRRRGKEKLYEPALFLSSEKDYKL